MPNVQLDENLNNLVPETKLDLCRFLQNAPLRNMLLKDGRSITDPTVWRDFNSLPTTCEERKEQRPSDPIPCEVHNECTLSRAVAGNAPEIVERLLQQGADPNVDEEKQDSTPLIEAAKEGFDQVMEILLKYRANVTQTTPAGYTPLHYASANGHLGCVKLLLKYQSPIEEQNENGHTPLMEATSNGHLEVARCLIEHGANINTHSVEFKESALTLASYKGHADMVKYLLDAGASHEHRTDEMHTALMEAAMEGHVDVARLLLEHGANVNIPQDSFESPLTLAACGGHTELVTLLLGYEADIEEVNDEGYTPLMEAAREGHEDTVAVLLAAGADVNAKTEETQETALTLAACGGFVEICDMLLKAGADLEVGGNGCSTALMEAAQEGHLELVRRLLQQGASIHATTTTGETALHYAAENGHYKVCQELINWGANSDNMTRVEDAKTPLMKAARSGHLEVVQLLVESGFSVNETTTHNDATALSLACSGGHAAVVEYLLRNGADPHHELRDGCTMMIECARSGSTTVARLLIDYPQSLTMSLTAAPSAGLHQPPPPPPLMQQNGNLPGMDSATLLLQHQAAATLNHQQLQRGGGAGGLPPMTVHNPQLKEALTRAYAKGWADGAASKTQEQLNNYRAAQAKAAAVAASATDPAAAAVNDIKLSPAEESAIFASLADLAHVTCPEEFTAKLVGLFQNCKGDTGDLLRRIGTSMTVNAGNQMTGGFEVNNPPTAAAASSVFAPTSSSGDHVANFPPGVYFQQQQQQQGPVSMPPAAMDLTMYDHLMHCQSAVGRPQHLSPPPHPPSAAGVVNNNGGGPAPAVSLPPGVAANSQQHVDINACTESANESALTLACSGGAVDLARLLLEKGANKEHRDKKSHTPLHTAVYSNQRAIVNLLLDYGADIEAQVDRTKDTALSIACTHGRLEIAEDLLARGANKEHRNFSDYTPLSLAASGGFVDVIKLLLNAGAEINSRTGSKLGISPLMLASMNGYTEAVRLLLESGSDINAQIETNKNTALTLACFQGQHEVVKLLVERKANIEHRAKTGLTPLMEAASGNHVKVGVILIENGADVNCPPVQSSRDTALTIAADKGKTEFVDLLLKHGANVEARNKKGATSLWLACNGGHLEVAQKLIEAKADVNSEDNRKVSCLSAAFRKGHVKVVSLLVQHVTQFPSDKDCQRHIRGLIHEKELAEKCEECRQLICAAKEKQDFEARKNADVLLEQIEQEEEERRNREAVRAQRIERKRKKRKAKQQQQQQQQVQQQHQDSVPIPTTTSVAKSQPLEVFATAPATPTRSESTPEEETLSQEDLSTRENPQQSSKATTTTTTNTGNKKKRQTKQPEETVSSPPELEQHSVSSTASEMFKTTAACTTNNEGGKREKTRSSAKKDSGKKSKASANSSSQQAVTESQLLPPNASNKPVETSSNDNSAYWENAAAFDQADEWVPAHPTSGSRNNRSITIVSSESGSDWKMTGANATGSTKRKTTIAVSKHDIGKIIGQGGAVVSALRTMSGIQIDIDSAKDDASTERNVYLRGHVDLVEQTKQIIQELINGTLAGNDVIARSKVTKLTTLNHPLAAPSTPLGITASSRLGSSTASTRRVGSTPVTSVKAVAASPQPLMSAKVSAPARVVSASKGPVTAVVPSWSSIGKPTAPPTTTQRSNFASVAAAAASTKGGRAKVSPTASVSSETPIQQRPSKPSPVPPLLQVQLPDINSNANNSGHNPLDESSFPPLSTVVPVTNGSGSTTVTSTTSVKFPPPLPPSGEQQPRKTSLPTPQPEVVLPSPVAVVTATTAPTQTFQQSPATAVSMAGGDSRRNPEMEVKLPTPPTSISSSSTASRSFALAPGSEWSANRHAGGGEPKQQRTTATLPPSAFGDADSAVFPSRLPVTGVGDGDSLFKTVSSHQMMTPLPPPSCSSQFESTTSASSSVAASSIWPGFEHSAFPRTAGFDFGGASANTRSVGGTNYSSASLFQGLPNMRGFDPGTTTAAAATAMEDGLNNPYRRPAGLDAFLSSASAFASSRGANAFPQQQPRDFAPFNGSSGSAGTPFLAQSSRLAGNPPPPQQMMPQQQQQQPPPPQLDRSEYFGAYANRAVGGVPGSGYSSLRSQQELMMQQHQPPPIGAERRRGPQHQAPQPPQPTSQQPPQQQQFSPAELMAQLLNHLGLADSASGGGWSSQSLSNPLWTQLAQLDASQMSPGLERLLSVFASTTANRGGTTGAAWMNPSPQMQGYPPPSQQQQPAVRMQQPAVPQQQQQVVVNAPGGSNAASAASEAPSSTLASAASASAPAVTESSS